VLVKKKTKIVRLDTSKVGASREQAVNDCIPLDSFVSAIVDGLRVARYCAATTKSKELINFAG
jgi:hypothetical protein